MLDRQSPEAQSALVVQYSPGTDLHVPARVREKPGRQAVQAPVLAEQAEQEPEVPAAQHTPPPHTPLVHSGEEVQVAPVALRVVHTPAAVITWSVGQLPMSHRPSRTSLAFWWPQLVHAVPTPAAQHA